MSKQQDEVTRILSCIFPDLQSEVTLNKITGVYSHRNIRVDIWLPSIRCVVEVHGIQHFKPRGFGGRGKTDSNVAFMDQLQRDSKLEKICNMFEINYEQIDYTEKIDVPGLYRRFLLYDACKNEG